MEEGQINRGSQFGELVYGLAKQSDVRTIVEFGTWNGCGTTKCILDGIRDSLLEKTFISVESNKDMYNKARENLSEHLNKITLLYGRIIDVFDLVWLKDIELSSIQQKWLWEDINSYKDCPFILDLIPKKIDFILLDGGEFSSVPEFIKLRGRYNYIALDDTRELKNKFIDQQLRKREDHELLYSGDEKNGFSIFKKIK